MLCCSMQPKPAVLLCWLLCLFTIVETRSILSFDKTAASIDDNFMKIVAVKSRPVGCPMFDSVDRSMTIISYENVHEADITLIKQGGTTTIACESDHIWSDGTTLYKQIFCQRDGTWSKLLHRCVAVCTKPPRSGANTMTEPAVYTDEIGTRFVLEKGTAVFACQTGYNWVDDVSGTMARAVRCIGPGMWEQISDCGPIVDCAFTWSQWSKCSASCGGGWQTRTPIVVAQQAHGGIACPSTERQMCNLHGCPCSTPLKLVSGSTAQIDYITDGLPINTPFDHHTIALVHCEQPDTQMMVATDEHGWLMAESCCAAVDGEIGGRMVKGADASSDTDRMSVCVNGTWTNAEEIERTTCIQMNPVWTAWSACSATCGTRRTRARTRLPHDRGCKTVRCNAETVQVEMCHDTCCPVDCQIGSWSQWTECSTSCGRGGERVRTRTNIEPLCGGAACPRDNNQGMTCGNVCCPVPCTVGAWTSWSACSAECGGGTQTRTRTNLEPTCAGAPCPTDNIQSQPCNNDACDTLCDSRVTLVVGSTASIEYENEQTEAPYQSGATLTVFCEDPNQVLIKTDKVGEPVASDSETSLTNSKRKIAKCKYGKWLGDNVGMIMPFTCVNAKREKGCPIPSGRGAPPNTLRFFSKPAGSKQPPVFYNPDTAQVMAIENAQMEICCASTQTWFGDEYRLALLTNPDLRTDVAGQDSNRNLGNCQRYNCETEDEVGDTLDTWKHINAQGQDRIASHIAVDWVCRPSGCPVFNVTEIDQSLRCEDCERVWSPYTAPIDGQRYVPVGTTVTVWCAQGRVNVPVSGVTCVFLGGQHIAGEWSDGMIYLDPNMLRCL